jgi:dihydrofolate reductase
MNLSLIAALDANNAIGYENQLLCHLPADLRHFKNLTTGHTVIMGRRTFESLPKGFLPNRLNIVISSTLEQPQNNTFIVKKNIDQALKFSENEQKIFIIGGESIYFQTIEMADNLYITEVLAAFPADAFFPKIDLNIWTEIGRENHQPDEKNKFSYNFVEYERKKI